MLAQLEDTVPLVQVPPKLVLEVNTKTQPTKPDAQVVLRAIIAQLEPPLTTRVSFPKTTNELSTSVLFHCFMLFFFH
jgi:hypothetical protein